MMGLREWRFTVLGMAAGHWWAWLFAGDVLRGTVGLVLYLLTLGAVELVAYLRRHVRWQREVGDA